MNLDFQTAKISIHAPCGREVVIASLNGKERVFDVNYAIIPENNDPNPNPRRTRKTAQVLIKHRCHASEGA
jgi:hypothetical protein